ncbi:MAG: glycerate kinase [Aliivibrio sp.]|uniref:glycerate kinase n=1 Tax=Aliivibrio sp. TaxID=1872443 RepID=UPI001A4BEA4A|nr:glycerate kinase [Aliivibrio sp.]
MKVVIAPDSYKESLTAKEVCNAIETGFRRVFPDAEYHSVPVADGGEGTVQSLVDATNGKLVEVELTGPLGNPVLAFYGILGDDSNTAVIEMAAASGLHHVPPLYRDPKNTTSFGTGELITLALNTGVKRLIIGLGGSATNDGGIGMMAALGVRFLDQNGQSVPLNGQGLHQIESIDISHLNPKLNECELLIASDVDNPLCGELGASAIFGPQKGATSADVEYLDNGLQHYSNKIEQCLQVSVAQTKGSGAAGGMGAAFMAFTRAVIKPGITVVLEAVDLISKMENTDLVLTGEGRIDEQTVHGKTPMGVAQLAKQFSIPVIGIAGCLGKNHQVVYECGIDAVFAATPRALSLDEALEHASENVTNLAENIANLWRLQY